MTSKVVLGLGTNLGNRISYLKQAIHLIKEQKILAEIKYSQIYESKALLPQNAPKSWNQSFLNMAIIGNCSYQPQILLTKIKSIEKQIGRIHRGFWSPREIDIDILIYDNLEINEDNLTIPHKHLLERPFVLLPINDLIPDWQYPKSGTFYNKSISSIIAEMNISLDECKTIDKII